MKAWEAPVERMGIGGANGMYGWGDAIILGSDTKKSRSLEKDYTRRVQKIQTW